MGSQIEWEDLAQHAWAARERAFAPYSKFAVGAALLVESGEIFSGCNIENASYSLTICAERVAASAAILGGFRHFVALAVVAETATFVIPCGACRQFLAEFTPTLPIYCVGRDGVHHTVLLSALFPSPFSQSALHS